MIQYYHYDEYEASLCDAFDELTRQFPNIRFFQPSPDRAPWHVQAILPTPAEDIVLNFWPHKEKAQRQPGRAIEGPNAARDIILDAINDQKALLRDDTAFDVIEDI